MNIKSIFLILVLFYCNLFAQENITINVSSYVRTTLSNPKGYFKGWGVNLAGIGSRNYYNLVSQAKRDEWAQLFWKDCDMRHYRVSAGNGRDIQVIYSAVKLDSMYGQYMRDISKNQKNKVIKVFDPHGGWSYYDSLESWSPWFTDSLMRDYIIKNANVIKDFKDLYGYEMDYVEITNEPQVFIDTTIPKTPPYYSWYNNDNRKKAVTMVNMWREELDKRGLHNTKVIGPSKSGVFAGFDTLILKDFKEDSVGMYNLKGYSYHSYTSPLVKIVVDSLKNFDVDIWQTESGQNPEQRGVANAISDINLGTNFWQHYQAYSWSGNNDTTGESGVRYSSIIYPNTDSVRLYHYLRFYYFRELMKAIPYRSRVHLSSAYQSSWSSLSTTIRNRYINMEPVGVEQPPVNATAVEASDGHWNLIVFNPDSIPNKYNPYVPYKQTDFNVTFNIPELDCFGVQLFYARKITKNKEELNFDTLTMNNGTIVISNVNDGDLVVLRSANVLTSNIYIKPIDTNKIEITNENINLTFFNPSTQTIRIRLVNTKGVTQKIIKTDTFNRGSYTILLDGVYNFKGYYVVESINNYGHPKLIKMISSYIRQR